ncbi:aminoglycoside phosphotransferase [Bifidobacterium myosotis]|uniref:Aminoglycoside phosphotransferase n=1 Tax=Bifidobacterium myosotis TaxID=1630166 RepID=A0A261FKZ6_9BIFI|nr:aminoglycoside phosphotransferase [Bifidobacterium myosotis]
MKRSNYVLAALTSAVLPNLAVAGVRESTQASSTDEAKGIDQAVVQDASGKLYDVYATDTKEGRTRLIRRVRAAQTLAAAREPGGLGFDLDRVITFCPGDVAKPGQTATAQAFQREDADAAAAATVDTGRPSPTGETTVMIAAHRQGQSRPLDLLTLDDCAAVGTALGSIHRLSPAFLTAAKYPVFTTGQIHAQLTAWIKRLRSAGHVPGEITNSWARVIETDGLWSFATCTVHGGFSDGDLLFSGSTITAVTNWQDMQVNDPARDLAWIFGKLDETHRNAVLSAYGRMMGSRLDDLIMLRANLWLQMEQVGEFIQALNRGDNDKIMQFKAQVERLAHQLGVISRDATPAPDAKAAAGGAGASGNGSPSTITVGTLLHDDRRRGTTPARPASDTAAHASGTGAKAVGAATAGTATGTTDATPDPDRTGSAEISAAGNVDVTPEVSGAASDRTADHPLADRPLAGTGTGSTAPQRSQSSPHSSVTITLKELLEMDKRVSSGSSRGAVGDGVAGTSADATKDSVAANGTATTGTASHGNPTGAVDRAAGGTGFSSASARPAATGARTFHVPRPLFPTSVRDDDDTGERFAHSSNAKTTVIPLLEREERALRDAHAGLDGYDADGNPVRGTAESAAAPAAESGAESRADQSSGHVTAANQATGHSDSQDSSSANEGTATADGADVSAFPAPNASEGAKESTTDSAADSTPSA